MAYTCQLIRGSEAIDLHLNDPGYTLLDNTLRLNAPDNKRIFGGEMRTALVREEFGQRRIPLECALKGSDTDDLIDRVNALRQMLLYAARYRKDGWGDETFLEVKPDSATESVLFPVLTGDMDLSHLYSRCCEPNDTIDSIPVTLYCESYWEYESTYTLENYVDNPGWWRWAAAPGDSWTEVNAADVTSTQDSDYYEVMGYSLKMVIAPDAVNDTGVQSDNITVVASTVHYFECRCLHTSGADNLTARVYDVSNGAVIAASALTFDNQDDAWEKLGVSFTTPVGCVSVRIEIQRLAADSSAGNKTYYVDAVYLEARSDAPTGWSSGRNLVNCLDDTADNINVLCVTEVPGEVEAEVKATLTLADTTTYMRVGKRTRDTPAPFIWHLTPCAAYTTAEGGVAGACTPGLTDATCKDSDKIVDATSPSGSRISVTFAGLQTMQPRCYWSITSDLSSYYGKFAVLVVAKMSGATDTATMQIGATDESNYQGRDKSSAEGIGIDISGTSWTLYDGWQVFSFRIGTHDNDLFGTGNNWQITLWAETDGTPTDTLHIAGAYLMPLDEAYAIAGGAASLAAAIDFVLEDMDGDRGAFAYSTASDTYYPNLGLVGQLPLLTPEIENYLYFISASPVWVFNDAWSVSLQYRPRGIFLRGSDPS